MAVTAMDELSREELEKRIRLLSELAIALDGLWFLAAEEAEGYDKALEMDVKVWKRYASLSVKRIRRYFDVRSTGLEAIKEFIAYDPFWFTIGFETVEDGPDRLVFQVRNCPSLEAMERMGRERLTCEAVELPYMENLAAAVDPRVKVRALKLPPRKSPDEIACKWLFYLDDSVR